MPSFNLIDEPWIPVTTPTGKPRLVGIRGVLAEAHQLDALASHSPLENGAVLRLLLAVLYRVLKGPQSNRARADLWREARWDPAAINGYLNQQVDHFDLFHPERPFYQDAGFALKKPDTSARLLPERTSGNNVLLFDHTQDDAAPALTPSEAARALLVHQGYGLSGGQGSTSKRYGKHPNLCQGSAAPGVSIFLRGQNLFQTLLLNLIPYPAKCVPTVGKDQPLWELDEPPEPGADQPNGLLDYLTWPNRCVRLVPEEVGEQVVVRKAHVAQCRTMDRDSGIRDPFFAMQPTKDGKVTPLRIESERALWRDSGSLFGWASEAGTKKGEELRPVVFREAFPLLEALGLRKTLNCTTVGIDFDQGKVNLWRSEALPVTPSLLASEQRSVELQAAVQTAENVGLALLSSIEKLASWLLAPSTGKVRRDDKTFVNLRRSFDVETPYWSRLDQPFRKLILALDEDSDAAIRTWNSEIHRAAHAAFEEVEAQAGRDARALHARVEARRLLYSRTWKLRPVVANDREEMTDAKAA